MKRCRLAALRRRNSLDDALEQLVDLAVQQYDEKARLAKDAAAAGVLVLAIGTVVIFAAVLVHNADAVLGNLGQVRRQVLCGVPMTFCAGALMHERARPGWVDGVLLAAALSLWGVTLQWTFSTVLSAMTFGMLVVCASAAFKRRRS